MFVDTYFKIACSFTNVNLITSTRAYVYYVRWMNVFVFEFEESFDLACLPQDMDNLTSISCGKHARSKLSSNSFGLIKFLTSVPF